MSDTIDHPNRQSWCIKMRMAGVEWYSTRYCNEGMAHKKAEELRKTDSGYEIEVIDL